MGTEGTKKRNKGKETASAGIDRYDWKRVHHSPLFWIGAFLFVVAVTIYLL